jgi:hypothetical protein
MSPKASKQAVEGRSLDRGVNPVGGLAAQIVGNDLRQ